MDIIAHKKQFIMIDKMYPHDAYIVNPSNSFNIIYREQKGQLVKS